MAIRVRANGSMWCAALTGAEPGDTYIDDGLHYAMSQEHGVIVALPMPAHVKNPRWWWTSEAPAGADFSAAEQRDQVVKAPEPLHSP